MLTFPVVTARYGAGCGRREAPVLETMLPGAVTGPDARGTSCQPGHHAVDQIGLGSERRPRRLGSANSGADSGKARVRPWPVTSSSCLSYSPFCGFRRPPRVVAGAPTSGPTTGVGQSATNGATDPPDAHAVEHDAKPRGTWRDGRPRRLRERNVLPPTFPGGAPNWTFLKAPPLCA